MLKIKSKKFLLGICFFVLFNYSFSQVAGDFRSIATGNWNVNTTWQSFDGTSWVAAAAAPTAASGTITIQSPNVVSISASFSNSASIVINSGGTLQTAATFTLTNNAAGIITVNGILINSSTLATGVIINNGVINNNLTFTNKGVFTNNLTLNNASAGTITQSSLAGAFTNASTGTITNIGNLTISSGRTIANNGTLSNSGTITTTGTLTNGAGSSYKHNYSSAFATAGTIPTATWNATSTCEILACGNSGNGPSGLGQAFGHFIWNNSTQPSDISLLGTMSMPTTGNFTLTTTNGFNLILKSTASGGSTTIGGNFILTNGNIVITKIVAPINTINQLSITGNYTQNGGSMTIVNSSGTLSSNTGNGTLTVGGTSLINAGTFNVCNSSWVGAGGNGTFAATGLITLSGGTLNGCSSSAIASGGSSGLITASAGITVSGGTLNLNSSTTTGGGGTTVLNSGGLVTLSSGTIDLASGAAAGATGCNGTLNANLAFTMTNGTLNLSSSSTTTGGGNGILNVSSGNFIHSGGTISKTGINSGTININGTAAQNIQSIGFTAGNIITFNISQNSSASATCAVPTAFTVSSGTTLNINDNNLNTVDFTTAVNMIVNGVVNVNTSAELDMGLLVLSGTGSFATYTDATLLTKNTNGIAATAMSGSIQVSGTRTYASDGNYTYNGTAAQITGDGLPILLDGGILNIANTLAPASGGVTLTQATTILEGMSTTGMLFFGGTTNGRLITTSTNLLTLGDNVTVNPVGGSATKFVDGPIKKVGDDLFIFPTGKIYIATGSINTAKWARIEISAPTNTTDEFIAEYFKVNDPCNVSQVVSSTNGVGINNVSWKEYWTLTRTSSAAVTPTVKLYWQTGSSSTSAGSAISSISSADLHVAECISLTWTDKGAGTTSGTAAGPGTIRTNIVTTFTTGTAMPFTFASPTGVNPLPIELLTFNGTSLSTGNQINWSTATESNNNYFDLEKSNNASEFITLTSINGAGNSTAIKNYQYLDANPFDGMNYYRLKQVDNNGDYSYSNVIVIENTNEENATVQVYPNPSNALVNIVSSENIASYVVYNALGETVYTNSSEENIQFNPLSKGVYLIKATSKQGKIITTRFVRN